ncbi:MAG: glutamine-hydrolyzing GMP synthase [Firmicutes bacterium]|nr:glutamine-hydrolyzing GMP synthase [Bacillota bacterium]
MEKVLVLDFGGQYKELIARTIRSLKVYSIIKPGTISVEEIKKIAPIGIILTGGPQSVYLEKSVKPDPAIFELGIPILGICYGMQLIAHMLGGEVSGEGAGEYGQFNVLPTREWALVTDKFGVHNAKPFKALMSHRDKVVRVPAGFVPTSHTDTCIASMDNHHKKIYGVQFHPEVSLTQGGKQIIQKFLYNICEARGDYKLGNFIKGIIKELKDSIGDKKVLLALSGGVDSSVCAALLSKAIPNQLTCIFVDHGFMRQGEGDEVEQVFSNMDLDFIRVNAQSRFLRKVEGVEEPETKRKIIGEEFIRVFEEAAAKLGDIPFLAQGTIYPDIVESGGAHGATIKSHHNVGGLPDNLKFSKLVEPLSSLFKDEVRKIGKRLGLPDFLVNRQPFPGPGLAIRVVGEITKEKLDTLREVDAIVRAELDKLSKKPNQYFAVLTNTKSVGVKGDDRVYDYVVAVRAVVTTDFMTATYMKIPYKILDTIVNRITSEIKTVSRVVYDVSSKPPSTIEWE